MCKSEMFKLYGRMFKVVASFPESGADQANAFMMANPETGVLAVQDGRVIIANLNDKGVAL